VAVTSRLSSAVQYPSRVSRTADDPVNDYEAPGIS
jgi:hypothetical protein